METDTSSTESVTPASDIALFKSGGNSATSGESVKTETATPAVERDESGKFKAKEEKPEVPTETKTEVKTEVKAEVEPKEKTPVSAMIAMRQRLQAAENRVRELEAGKTESPDIFTEPEKAVKALVDQQVAPIRQKFFMQSIDLAQTKHADFDAAAENATKLMDANPALEREFRAAEDPGEFIYQLGSNTAEFRQARDAKHKDELTAKDARIAALEAEVNTLKATKQAESEVPESLNRLPSGAVPSRDGDAMDINKIVRFKSG